MNDLIENNEDAFCQKLIDREPSPMNAEFNQQLTSDTHAASNLVKPQLSELLECLSSQGNWLPRSRPILQRFFSQSLPQDLDEVILCTLAALFVLQEWFKDT